MSVGNIRSMYNKRNKNEMKSNCQECGVERTVAYWDEELEYYIYLCDEPPLCSRCMSSQETAKSTVNRVGKSACAEAI
jgi:hypothetical protein